MASILRVNTLTDASSNNSTAMSTINQGTLKAWVNFNGTGTPSPRDSFNISSINDDGTGKYDYVYTSNMANANYSPCIGGNLNEGDSTGNTHADTRRIATTTSLHGIRGLVYDSSASGSFSDLLNCYAQVAGDLA